MEKIDLYDTNRKPLGKTAIKYMPLAEGEYQIIVHVCLFNDKNEMLIQQRALDKIDFPGMWDISSGGGVMAGEEAYQAAERELFEELGLSVSLEDERPYLTIHYPNGFDDYYLISCDKNINEFIFPQDEVLAITWKSKTEILQMIAEGNFINYNEGFIELLFSMKKNRGSYPRK